MKLSFPTLAGFDRRTEKNKDDHLSINQRSSWFNPGSHEGASVWETPPRRPPAVWVLAVYCISAMGLVANKTKVKLPAEVAVDAETDLCNSGDVYFLRARLNVSLPGLESEVAQAIVDATHREICAYSNATRGNIDVTLNVV